ncbi:MAG: ferric reductase-like transmembrane domain-containing protein [Candidatus Iainarchaeum archaeon]|uniref:Ferric reductase-like transmembrane domain-containing protein n=1 Tax=Candidatus Iainarchaeum sp. TaxID=3101447 RepID=A0A7T9I238_9ARCH|nr:MAG: ferric reductase-like transmembrane domain-containing protein [Candidatus Diapherotrites archaeon]
MQKTSMLFWILGIALTLLGVYESFFPSTPALLFIRLFGLAALLFTCVSLMIGPLTVLFPNRFAALIEPRRAVGLSAFVFMLAHFALVLVHVYVYAIELAFASLDTTLGTIGFVVFALVAFVSSDYAVKKLGSSWWKRIQQLTYVAFVIIVGHFFLSQKGPFIPLGNGQTFIHLAELFLWVLVLATILLQVLGFLAKRKRMQPPPAHLPPQ